MTRISAGSSRNLKPALVIDGSLRAIGPTDLQMARRVILVFNGRNKAHRINPSTFNGSDSRALGVKDLLHGLAFLLSPAFKRQLAKKVGWWCSTGRLHVTPKHPSRKSIERFAQSYKSNRYQSGRSTDSASDRKR